MRRQGWPLEATWIGSVKQPISGGPGLRNVPVLPGRYDMHSFPTRLPLLCLFLAACGGARATTLSRAVTDTLPGGIVRVMSSGPTAWTDSTGARLVEEGRFQGPDGTPAELGDPMSVAVDDAGRITPLTDSSTTRTRSPTPAPSTRIGRFSWARPADRSESPTSASRTAPRRSSVKTVSVPCVTTTVPAESRLISWRESASVPIHSGCPGYEKTRAT